KFRSPFHAEPAQIACQNLDRSFCGYPGSVHTRSQFPRCLMVSPAPRAAPLADKFPLSTESCVKARLGALKLQIRAEKAPVWGGVMPAKRTSKANLKSIMGSALLAGGSIVMVAYLGLIGSQFGISLNDSLTGCPFSSLSLGLASLHVLQS